MHIGLTWDLQTPYSTVICKNMSGTLARGCVPMKPWVRGRAHHEQCSVALAGLLPVQAWQVRCMLHHQEQRVNSAYIGTGDVRGPEPQVRVPLAQTVEDLRRRTHTPCLSWPRMLAFTQ